MEHKDFHNKVNELYYTQMKVVDLKCEILQEIIHNPDNFKHLFQINWDRLFRIEVDKHPKRFGKV